MVWTLGVLIAPGPKHVLKCFKGPKSDTCEFQYEITFAIIAFLNFSEAGEPRSGELMTGSRVWEDVRCALHEAC